LIDLSFCSSFVQILWSQEEKKEKLSKTDLSVAF